MRVLVLLLALGAAIANAAPPACAPGCAPPEGTPYLHATITFSSTFNPSDVQNSVSSWFAANSALAPGPSDVNIYHSTLASPGVQFFILTLEANVANEVQMLSGWKAIGGPLMLGAVLDSAAYTPTAVAIEENFVTSNVIYSLEPAPNGYDHSWASGFRIVMDHPTTFGGTVEITIACIGANSANLEFDNAVQTITHQWPPIAQFAMRASPGVYSFSLSVTGGTDSASRFTVNATLPTYTVGQKMNISITEPTLETYEGAPSDTYAIQVPVHRESSIDLIVSVIPDNNAVTVWPSNITVNGPGISKFFFITAATPGIYSLSYVIADPWMSATGLVARSNTDFNQPRLTSTVVVHPSLNTSIASIPRGYLINDPILDSDTGNVVGNWGGAYSEPFLVHIEKAPRVMLTLTPAATDVTFQPAALTFSPGGAIQQWVVARALTKGVKSISFTRGGSDQAYYADPTPKNWMVQGPNRLCHAETTEAGCWGQSACQWDAMRGACTNTTLPMYLSTVPELFHLEESRNISLTLATPSRSGLTVSFPTDPRLIFNPTTIYFAPGESVANFTITGDLGATGTRVSQPFMMTLSGGDARIFTQIEATVDIRPKIQCVVTVPMAFFVGTESQEFTLACDTPPEVDVTFTPQTLPGINWVPVGGSAGDGFTMLPSMSTANFIAISTTTQVGAFNFIVDVTGTNAARYDQISRVVITVLPSGEVLTPPKFYLTAFDMSPFFHCDISVQPPSILEVAVTVHDRDSGSITDRATVLPPILKFNNTKRNFIRAVSENPGNYTLIFTVSGANQRNYKTPAPLDFEVKPRLDGAAFAARTTAGYTPELRCRVQVGFQSLAFKGQAAIEGTNHFCNSYSSPAVNTTYNCSVHVTEERCRNEMETGGNVCVWHQESCIFIDSMQGRVKQVAFGSGFTVILSTEGRIFTIGSTKYGQLGHYSNDLQEVVMPESIVTISAGTSHTLALSNEGRLYSWGANYKGQLGQNSRVKQTEVVSKVVFPKGENITCISSGTLHSGALTLTGKVHMWGSNEYGQLGSKPSYRSITLAPQQIKRDYLGGEPALALQCGEYHTMVGTAVDAYTFGSNTMGQLGREGFDEWLPAPPVHYFKNTHNRQPLHPSWITGKDNC